MGRDSRCIRRVLGYLTRAASPDVDVAATRCLAGDLMHAIIGAHSFLAFVVVLALIGLAAWLVRRFAGNRLGTNASRGRMPRLAVIDAAAVDGRRRLVLVRRDNVEHLLMIGGPTDIVVEPNIVRAMPGRDQAPPRASVGSRCRRASPPLPEAPSWADSDSSASMPNRIVPEPAPRPARPSFIDEPRRPVRAAARAPSRSGRQLHARAARRGPEPRRPAQRATAAARRCRAAKCHVPRCRWRSAAQRTDDAAPRCAPMPPIRTTPPPARRTVRVAARRQRAAPVAATGAGPGRRRPHRCRSPHRAASRRPEPRRHGAAARSRAAPPGRRDPRRGARAAHRRATGCAGAPPSRSAPATPEVSIASRAPSRRAAGRRRRSRSGFENLEDEMASLLGRPKSSS